MGLKTSQKLVYKITISYDMCEHFTAHSDVNYDDFVVVLAS